MRSMEAIYENGHLQAGNEPLPNCRTKVIVTFLDEELKDDELSPEWKAEIDRRIADLDSGKTEMLDGEDVFKDLKKKYQ
ncbi:MAG: addiction module protein [Lentisphaeria bacterium]|nr:addiction module protein [Lentisphaeria bacterium]NQZ67369.1 addiction module protein [Lentisphaeria bacterium]